MKDLYDLCRLRAQRYLNYDEMKPIVFEYLKTWTPEKQEALESAQNDLNENGNFDSINTKKNKKRFKKVAISAQKKQNKRLTV